MWHETQYINELSLNVNYPMWNIHAPVKDRHIPKWLCVAKYVTMVGPLQHPTTEQKYAVHLSLKGPILFIIQEWYAHWRCYHIMYCENETDNLLSATGTRPPCNSYNVNSGFTPKFMKKQTPFMQYVTWNQFYVGCILQGDGWGQEYRRELCLRRNAPHLWPTSNGRWVSHL